MTDFNDFFLVDGFGWCGFIFLQKTEGLPKLEKTLSQIFRTQSSTTDLWSHGSFRRGYFLQPKLLGHIQSCQTGGLVLKKGYLFLEALWYEQGRLHAPWCTSRFHILPLLAKYRNIPQKSLKISKWYSYKHPSSLLAYWPLVQTPRRGVQVQPKRDVNETCCAQWDAACREWGSSLVQESAYILTLEFCHTGQKLNLSFYQPLSNLFLRGKYNHVPKSTPNSGRKPSLATHQSSWTLDGDIRHIRKALGAFLHALSLLQQYAWQPQQFSHRLITCWSFDGRLAV